MSLDPITAGLDLANKVFDKFFPDANMELKGKLEQAATEIANQHAQVIAQLEINKEEAKHPSRFVAGWRPALGWVGVASLAYNFFFAPILNGLAAIFGLSPVFIGTPTQEMISLIGGLTGLTVARSVEKVRNVDTKQTKGK